MDGWRYLSSFQCKWISSWEATVLDTNHTFNLVTPVNLQLTCSIQTDGQGHKTVCAIRHFTAWTVHPEMFFFFNNIFWQILYQQSKFYPHTADFMLFSFLLMTMYTVDCHPEHQTSWKHMKYLFNKQVSNVSHKCIYFRWSTIAIPCIKYVQD